jgi:hypothetical protein
MKESDSSGSGLIPEISPSHDAPIYVPPKIVSYTSEEILEQIGPALACSSPQSSGLPG